MVLAWFSRDGQADRRHPHSSRNRGDLRQHRSRASLHCHPHGAAGPGIQLELPAALGAGVDLFFVISGFHHGLSVEPTLRQARRRQDFRVAEIVAHRAALLVRDGAAARQNAGPA